MPSCCQPPHCARQLACMCVAVGEHAHDSWRTCVWRLVCVGMTVLTRQKYVVKPDRKAPATWANWLLLERLYRGGVIFRRSSTIRAIAVRPNLRGLRSIWLVSKETVCSCTKGDGRHCLILNSSNLCYLNANSG